MQIPPLDPRLRDFRNALYAIFKVLGLPNPTPLQYDAAHFLQHGGDRKLLMGYRGMGKTYLATMWDVHEHRLEVDDHGQSALATLMLSAGKDFADIISTFAMRLMREVDFYQCLLPEQDQFTSTVKFDVGPKAPMKDPSFKSAGIFGQTVGSRSHRIVADDLEVPNTAGTVGMRDKLKQRVEGLQDLLPPEGGKITFLGTPHFEDSIYSWLQEHGGYEVRMYPARYPGPERARQMGPALAPIIREALEADPSLVGKPTDPMRWDEEALLAREAASTRSHFARQYLLDTTLGDRESHPLRLSDLVVTEVHPQVAPRLTVWGSNPVDDIAVWGLTGDRFNRPIQVAGDPEMDEYTGAIMAVDPSGRGKDETAWCVTKILNSMIFVPDFGGYLSGFEDATLRGLAETAKAQGVNSILVESNYGGGMFEQLLMPHLRAVGYPCEIISETAKGQKEARICDILEPLLNQHRLAVDINALRRDAAPRDGLGIEAAMQYRLAYQMSRVTRERGCLAHDDRLDVLALGCSYWIDQLARDANQVLEDQQEDEMDEFVREWMGTSPTSWHDSLLPRPLR